MQGMKLPDTQVCSLPLQLAPVRSMINRLAMIVLCQMSSIAQISQSLRVISRR